MVGCVWDASRMFRFALGMVVALILLSPLARGVNRYCVATGNWGDAAIWSGGVVPTSSDDVYIGGGYSVTMNTSGNCARLQLGRTTAIPNGGILLFTVSGPALSVHGDVVIGVAGGGAGALSMTTGELRLEGNMTIGNGGIIATGGIIYYNGSGNQNVASATYYSLYTGGGGTKTAAGPLTVKSSLLTYSTPLDFGSYTHHLLGSLSGASIPGTGTILFEGTGSKFIGGCTVHNLVIGGSGTTTVTNDSRVTGDLTINSGATLFGGGYVVTIEGDWTNNGVFTAASGTVQFSGSGTQRINNGPGEFGNLLFNSGVKEARADLVVNGIFEMHSCTYRVLPAFDTYVRGEFSADGTFDLGNTTFWFDGTIPQVIPGYLTYGNLRLAGGPKFATGDLTVSGNLVVDPGATFNPGLYNHHLKGNLKNDGTVLPGTGLTIFDGTPPQFIRGSGNTVLNNIGCVNTAVTAESPFTVADFYVDGSATFHAGGQIMIVTGDFNAGGQFDAGTGTIILNSAQPQSIVGGPRFRNLALSGAGLKTANQSMTVDSIFLINPAATFNSGAVTHHINGDWIKAGAFAPGSGTIAFSGTHPQLITGTFRFNNLTVDNDSGVGFVSATGDSVISALTFSRGNLFLGAADVTLEPGATVSGAGAGHCIVTTGTGRVRRTIAGGASAGSFVFPVSPNRTSYNPVTIALRPNASEPTETFTVRVEEFGTGSPGFVITDTSYCTKRVWTINEGTVGGNRTNLTFQWNETEDGSNIGIDPGAPVQSTAYVFVASTGKYERADDATGPAHLNNPIIAGTQGYTTISFGPYIVGSLPERVHANVKFLLGGPYNPATQLMSKSLNTNGSLASRYGVPVHPDAVDSVAIEVRNALTGAGSTIRRFVPAWLLTDGTIRDFHDTTRSGVDVDVPSGNYYVAVHHANHLPVMSAVAQTLTDSSPLYDFTLSQSQAFGTSPMLQVGTRYALYPGDGNQSNIVSAADANAVLGSLNATGYSSSDINLSGIVTSADANIVLGNLNRAGQVP